MAKHRYVIDGQSYEVEVNARFGAHADVTVNGQRYRVESAVAATVEAAARVAAARPSTPRVRRAARAEAGELRAPMAGLVLRLHVAEGQQLAAGDSVLVLDAMKMENSIRSPHAGVVQELAVREGQTVLTGALLARIAATRS